MGAVVEELHGEKMDIVAWNEDPAVFVASALAPADVVSVTVLPGQKACRVVVPDDQLSLAIGREGQNARLAARLTGYKIDIRPASRAGEDEEDAPAEPDGGTAPPETEPETAETAAGEPDGRQSGMEETEPEPEETESPAQEEEPEDEETAEEEPEDAEETGTESGGPAGEPEEE